MLSGLSPRPNGRLARRSRHPNQVPYMDKYSSLGKIFRVSWFNKKQFFNFNKNQYWYVTFLNFFCFKQRGLTSGPFNLKSQAYAQVKTMPFNIPVDHLNETYMVSRSEVRYCPCDNSHLTQHPPLFDRIYNGGWHSMHCSCCNILFMHLFTKLMLQEATL